MILNHRNEILNKKYRLKIAYLNDDGVGVASNLSISNKLKKKFLLLVPGTLNNEIILAKPIKIINEKIFFSILEILASNKNRQKEDCKKFLSCGGCDFRHVNQLWLQNYKLKNLYNFKKKTGIDYQLLPLFQSENFSRQRASFSAKINNHILQIGFMSIFENKIEDLYECKTLSKELLKVFRTLKNELPNFIIKKNFIFRVQVNCLENGVDILFDLHKTPKDKVFIIDGLINLLISMNVVRVCFKQNSKSSIFPFRNELRNDLGTLNGVRLYSFPPPGGFLQATKSGERNIIKYVLSAVKGSKKVIDLFCGSGTISIPLHQFVSIVCVDTNIDALEGLKKGLSLNKSKNMYEIIHQDLLKRPIKKNILNGIDTVVLNPPSKGAKNQVYEIAVSDVNMVVYVSCNFKTFERDAKILLENNFIIDWIKPIDQFPHTSHLEIVTKFSKIEKGNLCV